MLKINAGRVFCAMPRSTIQTSPRLGVGILLAVENGKNFSGSGRQLLVRRSIARKLRCTMDYSIAELALRVG
jgi:hypothetical protein